MHTALRAGVLGMAKRIDAIALGLTSKWSQHRAIATPVLTGSIALLVLTWVWSRVAADALALARNAGDAWQTGDYLINYEGGFIRRGLIGQIILSIASDQSSVLWLAFGIQIGALAVVTVAAFALFLRTNMTAGWLALLLSPAFLLFPGLDPVGGTRKELLVLAVVALFALVARFRLPEWVLLLPCAMYPLIVLSHEMAALAAPSILYLIWFRYRGIDGRSWRRRTLFIFVTAVAVSGSLLASLFPGTTTQSEAICVSLMRLGVREALCGGPIEYLGTSSAEAFKFLASLYPSMWSYLGLAALSTLPFAALGSKIRFWWLAAISTLMLTPLYLLGIDYGRWIFFDASMLSLVLLATWQRDTRTPWKVPLVVSIAYFSLWAVPYTPGGSSAPLVVYLAQSL